MSRFLNRQERALFVETIDGETILFESVNALIEHVRRIGIRRFGTRFGCDGSAHRHGGGYDRTTRLYHGRMRFYDDGGAPASGTYRIGDRLWLEPFFCAPERARLCHREHCACSRCPHFARYVILDGLGRTVDVYDLPGADKILGPRPSHRRQRLWLLRPHRSRTNRSLRTVAHSARRQAVSDDEIRRLCRDGIDDEGHALACARPLRPRRTVSVPCYNDSWDGLSRLNQANWKRQRRHQWKDGG